MQINKKKKILFFLGFLILAGLIFLFPELTQAAWYDDVMDCMGNPGISDIGKVLLAFPLILVTLICFLIQVVCWVVIYMISQLVDQFFSAEFYSTQIGGFALNEVVRNGWRIVTYICNIGYIIALLFIGVGTLLRIEKYNYKRNLIRLVIAALLTNFSLSFAGIILDFAHMIMFTVFKDPMDVMFDTITNFFWGYTEGFFDNLKTFLCTKEFEEAVAIAFVPIIVTAFLIIAAVTFVAVAFFLVVRVVVLWIYLVLSPFPYLGLAMPDLQFLIGKWWSGFIKYAFMGPILFFFIWFAAKVMTVTFKDKGVAVNQGIEQQTDFKDQSIMDRLYSVAEGDNQNSCSVDETMAAGVAGSPEELTKKDDSDFFANQNIWLVMIFFVVLIWGGLFAATQLGATGASMFMNVASKAVKAAPLLPYLGFRGYLEGRRGLSKYQANRARRKAGYAERDAEKARLAGDTDKSQRLMKKSEKYQQKEAQAHQNFKKLGKMKSYSNPVRLYRAWKMKREEEWKEEDRENLNKFVAGVNNLIDQESGETEFQKKISGFKAEQQRISARKEVEDNATKITREEKNKRRKERMMTKAQQKQNKIQEEINRNKEKQKELEERKNKLEENLESSKKFGAGKAGEDLEKEIKGIEDELEKLGETLEDKNKELENQDQLVQSATAEFDQVDKTIQQLGSRINDLKDKYKLDDKMSDKEYGELAASKIDRIHAKKAANMEREMDMRVNRFKDQYVNEHNTSVLTDNYNATSDLYEKMALLFRIAEEKGQTEFLRLQGYNPDDLAKYIEDNFYQDERMKKEVARRMNNIAVANKNFSQMGVTYNEDITNELKLTAGKPGKKSGFMGAIMASLPNSEILRNLREEVFINKKADGTEELATGAQTTLEQFSKEFIKSEHFAHNLNPETARAFKKLHSDYKGKIKGQAKENLEAITEKLSEIENKGI
jgi:hypothetical protein